MDEHRIIERVLCAMEKNAFRLQEGKDVRPEFFIEVSDFIKGFADGCHHRKEEGVLFEYMVAQGIPKQNGPIQIMLLEHEQARTYTRAMREAALNFHSGDSSAKEVIIHNALGYVSLLRQHIMKEDNILFPLADQVIPLLSYSDVIKAFERLEHEDIGSGVHEKYLALAERLEKEAN